MQDEDRHLLHVLPALLQHPCTHQPAVLCKLLSISTALAATVECLCRKVVAVKASPLAAFRVLENQFVDVLASMCSWVVHHGSLIRSLELQLPYTSEAPTAVAAALQAAAAAAPSGLLEMHSFNVSPLTCEMLDQLSPQHLQALYINEFVPDEDSIKEVSQHLRKFTALQLLHLKAGVKLEVLRLVLPALASLRALHIDCCYAVHLHKLVQWIPAAALLQDLELSSIAAPSSHDGLMPLDMGHLSALTAIRSLRRVLHLREGDVLPPKLLEVAVCCPTLQPVLQLQHLRDLTLAPAVEGILMLPQLSSAFTGLTALKLSVEHSLLQNWHQATAGQWKRLPLSSITVGFVAPFFVSCEQQGLSSTLQLLIGLPRLTSLDCVAYFDHVNARGAAVVLQQLTTLHSLSLEKCCGQCSSTMSELLDAVEALPQLQRLKLSHETALTDAAVLLLSRLTRLTALTLYTCQAAGDDEVSVPAWLSLTSLTGLKSLSLSGCAGVCDDVIAGFASSLQHLTTLDLKSTDVTAQGVMCLTSLHNLQQLALPYHIR